MPHKTAHLAVVDQSVKVVFSKNVAVLKMATISATSDESYITLVKFLTTFLGDLKSVQCQLIVAIDFTIEFQNFKILKRWKKSAYF